MSVLSPGPQAHLSAQIWDSPRPQQPLPLGCHPMFFPHPCLGPAPHSPVPSVPGPRASPRQPCTHEDAIICPHSQTHTSWEQVAHGMQRKSWSGGSGTCVQVRLCTSVTVCVCVQVNMCTYMHVCVQL